MSKKAKSTQPFWLGGAASSMAACFTHLLDQTKYRMQVLSAKRPMLQTLIMFARRDGLFSLWSGLSASILRQSTYSTTRFGLYNVFASRMRQQLDTKQLSTAATAACAGLAGGIAGMVGNPTEVILVRMCADGAKAPTDRFFYTDALHGMARIAREEGLWTFARGLGPNLVRSVLMNTSQIVVYAATKSELLASDWLKLEDGVPSHFFASLTAGTVATTVCAPADVIKSRMQSASVGPGHRRVSCLTCLEKGSVDC